MEVVNPNLIEFISIYLSIYLFQCELIYLVLYLSFSLSLYIYINIYICVCMCVCVCVCVDLISKLRLFFYNSLYINISQLVKNVSLQSKVINSNLSVITSIYLSIYLSISVCLHRSLFISLFLHLFKSLNL